MEREQIIREDFPTSRKGWDPDAVRAHLRAVADSMGAAPEQTLGDVAADRVRSVLAAAEATATEIARSAEADAGAERRAAEEEAGRIVAEARAEAGRLLEGARSDASSHSSAAQEAVVSLIAEAEQLRARVAELGERVAGSGRALEGPSAEVPGPVIVPEPTPPAIPEPTPDPVPEPTPDPTPDPVPEPMPDPTPEPTPDPPDPGFPDEPDRLPPSPEPTPPPASSTTEDLIAQLRAGSSQGDVANGSTEASSGGGPDLGAARLVAMNMALDGADRERITTELRREFGDLDGLDGLVDEVLVRAAG